MTSCLTATPGFSHDHASERARHRFARLEGRPLLLADWQRTVMIHFAVPPARLQPAVPLPLHTRDGMAYVSLVAFTMHRLRLNRAGPIGRWLMVPGATHGLLNVRTYVTHRREPGIFFLKEWIPNPLSVFIGPRLYGLPYRLGRLDYRHHHEHGQLGGTVTPAHDPGRLTYHATLPTDATFRRAAPGSLAAFLFEHYTAYTLRGRSQCRFRIWHEPWPIASIDLTLVDDSAFRACGPWTADARQTAAHYSPGVHDVWMSPPRPLRPRTRRRTRTRSPATGRATMPP